MIRRVVPTRGDERLREFLVNEPSGEVKKMKVFNCNKMSFHFAKFIHGQNSTNVQPWSCNGMACRNDCLKVKKISLEYLVKTFDRHIIFINHDNQNCMHIPVSMRQTLDDECA